MSGPDLSSTLKDGAMALHPGLGGSNDTVSGAGLIPPPNLSDSPPKRARNDKKSSRGSKRNDLPNDLDPSFTREFTKLTDEKKSIRDNGKTERRDAAECHYDNKCNNKFTVAISDDLKGSLNMQQALAVAVTHKNYLDNFRESFIECVLTRYGETITEKVDPFAPVDLAEFKNHFTKFVSLFQDNLASMNHSILVFREGLVHNCDFGNEDELRHNLLHLVNHVLGFARNTIDSTNSEVDYRKVLNESFAGAAGSSYLAEGDSAGCVAESLLLATVNLHTSLKLADATKKQNYTLNELGNQVTKLSIDILEHNVDKAEKILQIKNLGNAVPSHGTNGSKYTAVRNYFSPGGTFPLEGLDDVFALNANQGHVFIRFLTSRYKYMAENKIKQARVANSVKFITNRANVATFNSDMREPINSVKLSLWREYVNELRRNGLDDLIPTQPAFSRGIFVDEKNTRVGGNFKLWYEFTDPTTMTDILVYYYGANPFSGFEWRNPIPNSKFRTNHTNPNEWGIRVRGVHNLNKNFPK